MNRAVLTSSLRQLLLALSNSAAPAHFRYVTEGRGGYWCGTMRVRTATFVTAVQLGLLVELFHNTPRRWGPSAEVPRLLADPHYQPKCLQEEG